jgi:hypothetical protein
MTIKKGLENKIRGWFPKEPYLATSQIKMEFKVKQAPLVIPPECNVSATKAAGGFGVFWIIVYGFMFSNILNLGRYPISVFQMMAWIIAGLTVGVISCIVFTKNQLGRLSKNYQIYVNGKDMVLLIVPIVLFFIFGAFVSWSIKPSVGGAGFQGLLIAAYSWGVSSVITRTILFAAFEKKESMRIMQSWFGSGFALIPKPPRNNANGLDKVAQQGSPGKIG